MVQEGGTISPLSASVSFTIDDRDKALLNFLRENAGRPFPVKDLCAKFGYNGKGSGSQLRKKLNVFLREGYPVRRITAGRNSGAMWCLQGRQLLHYADKLEERAKAILSLASAARSAGSSLTRRELERW